MRITDFPPELLSSSYKMFLEQVSGQVGSVRIFLTDFDMHPSTQELSQILTQMHQLKGGAGFFGLEKVAQAAAAVQEELKSVSKASECSSKENLEKLFSELESAVSNIPSPESLLQIMNVK